MPNWIEGTFRARGHMKNLDAFVQNALFVGGDREHTLEKEFDTYYDNDSGKELWIRGSERQFLEAHCIDYIELGDDDYVFVCDFVGAWAIDKKAITSLSKEYGIRIRVNGFEHGREFEETLEVDSGKEIEHTVKEYEGTEQWYWYCPMPRMGG